MFIQEKTDAKNPRDQWKNRQDQFTAPAIRYWYIQHFSKMALENINEGLKEESFHETKIFSAENDFSIAHVKRKGLKYAII